MGHRILCIDMDAFYVSVEQSFKPYLKNKPLAVGGSRSRGVVCTCSYEARKYGIHSGMSSKIAVELCPDIIFMSVDSKKYIKTSNNIFSLLSKILPTIHVSSIDEAYADITSINMDTKQLIKKIKYIIKKYFDITCTIGVGPNKMMAKMATNVNKPNGYYIVEDKDAISFIDSFSLSNLWGIGSSTESKLAEHGIFTVQDLRMIEQDKIEDMLGIYGKKLHNAVNGVYEEDEYVKLENKSISKATTFEYDISSKNEIYSYLYNLSEQISEKLIFNNYKATVITLNWKTFRFENKSLRKKILNQFYTHEDIYKYSKTLFDEHDDSLVPIRLIGVGVAGLIQE